jgi:hypothetical protein
MTACSRVCRLSVGRLPSDIYDRLWPGPVRGTPDLNERNFSITAEKSDCPTGSRHLRFTNKLSIWLRFASRVMPEVGKKGLRGVMSQGRRLA